VYVALARAFIRTGSEDQLDELSKQMRLQGLPPSRFLHNAIIDALVQAGRLDDAEAQVQRLLAEGLEPNRYTYFPIFMAYTAKDQLPSAQRIFALMETTRGCEPDEPAYLRMGTAWTRVGQHAQARSVLDRLHARGKPTVFAANLYSAIVQGLAASGAPEQAEGTVADMKTRNCVPSVQALMALAASWAAAGQSGRQAEVQAQLKSQGVELDDAQIASLQASWNATKKKTVPS
jgi:pentatricopeptide repeat protein